MSSMSEEGIEMRTINDVEAGAQYNPAYDKALSEIMEDGSGGQADEEDQSKSRRTAVIESVQDGVSQFFKQNSITTRYGVYLVLIVLYFVYFAYSMTYYFGDEPSVRLFVVTLLTVMAIFGTWIYRLNEEKIKNTLHNSWISQSDSNRERMKNTLKWSYYAFMVAFAIFALLYVIIAVARHTPKSAIPLGGIAAFVLSFYIFSVNPSKVIWRPVLWGLYLQFALACIILRWKFGFEAFQWLGDRISEFLAYADVGSEFVFGNTYTHHFFAFKVLPVIIFFSTIISMLYYLGVMQFIIRYIARFMAMLMGTSPAESLSAAGNIFVGMTESPLMIRPILHDLTMSELHAVFTGGFATIAGSVMAAYIQFNVPANHLLAASVMSAPAALAMSKLFYPETERVKISKQGYNMERLPERNLIDAASNGASNSVKLVANVAVNLIAFLAILAFVNATLQWFGQRAGMNNPLLTFELICSYIFYPMAFLMGVDSINCRNVAEIIGVKTFLNEFVAYSRLSVFINNRKYWVSHQGSVYRCVKGGLFYPSLNHTLVGGMMTVRSEVVATYALCGFANFGSMGIMLGALGAMAPSRKSDMSRIVLRAMIAGNVACFMTACIAGVLLDRPTSMLDDRLDDLLLNNILCP